MMITHILLQITVSNQYITFFFFVFHSIELVFVRNDIHMYTASMQQTTSSTQHKKVSKLMPKCLKNTLYVMISTEVCSSLVTRK